MSLDCCAMVVWFKVTYTVLKTNVSIRSVVGAVIYGMNKDQTKRVYFIEGISFSH